MKIAIIGSGISGLTAAHLLCKDFDITVFEANDYIGGHTHTHDLEIEKKTGESILGLLSIMKRPIQTLLSCLKNLKLLLKKHQWDLA